MEDKGRHDPALGGLVIVFHEKGSCEMMVCLACLRAGQTAPFL